MKENKIIQTIVLTIFIIALMILTIRILPVNLTKALEAMVNSVPDTDLEGESAMIYYGAAVFSIGIAGIGFHILAIFILIASLIFLACAVHNRHSNSKWIRFFNYALAVCCMFMFISSITKIILWRCGY